MNDTVRKLTGYGVPIAWIITVLALAGQLSPVGRFLGATVGLLLSIKIGSWILLDARSREYTLTSVQTLLFWTVWPGVRPDLFEGAEEYAAPEARTFVVGYVSVMVGVVLAFASVLALPVVGMDVSTWLLLFAALAVVHSGLGRILPFSLRWLGYPVPPLFVDPLRSDSVGDFWSTRWNRPFVGMNRLYVTGPLSSRIGIARAAFVAFVVSGLLHELAISYTAGGGWGAPFLYFVLQAVAYTAEQTWFPDDGNAVIRRLWTYAVVFGPLALLFHAPFRTTFVVPVVEAGRAVLLSNPLSAYVAAGLWIGACGHFLILLASWRVPDELDWHTDLRSLQSLNRKLMWTYGGFIVLMIVAFGVMSALFHEQLLAGTPVALGLSGLIAVFWTARILVDGLYFSHDDWPDGIEFVVGHTMLTSLFVLLVLIYGGTIAYHVA